MHFKTVPRLTLMLVVFLCTVLNTFAQNRVVTGKVTDQSGIGIQGVTVSVKGSSTSTQTGADGSYSISAPANSTLLFTSVGYGTIEMDLKDQTTLNATLGINATNLSEVVVTGYSTQRRATVAGAITSVKAKDFNQGVITSPDQLLQGKVPGLEITSNTGQPGVATTTKIRGNNTIRANNNPLYVVDGVPLDGRTARPSLNLGSNGLGFGPTPESNPLLYINPNDIAQIDVLKDAASAAIYGSRGANGVIVITTKKATGSGTKLEFNSSIGAFAGYMKKYELLSAGDYRSALKSYKLDTLGYDQGASVDMLDEIKQNNITQNYSLAFSGGNETGKFRASFLGARIPGIIKNTSLDKYLGNFGGSYNFFDRRLTLDFDLIAGHTIENIGLFSNTAGAGGNIMAWVMNWNPTAPVRNSTGGFNLQSNSVPNPIAVTEGFSDVANVNTFLGNISATVKLFKGLDYKYLFAVNHGTGERLTNIGGWLSGIQGISGLGYAGISHATLTSRTIQHLLTYSSQISPNLNLNAVAGYEYWRTDYSNNTLAATQFNTNLDEKNRIDVPYTSFFQNAKVQYPMTTFVDPKTEIQSYFARLTFSYRDKYILNGIIRADGSNKFGENNRYGYFPSIGAKWNISNEGFMQNNTTFSGLSLRGSWGITGNQEFPAGASLEQFTSTAYNNIGQSNVANPDLKWEKTTTIDIGADFSILKNRVTATIDYYHKNTTDLLFQSTAIQPAPASVFYINLPANLINEGVEFGIGASIIAKKSFSWDLGVNFAHNDNILKNFNQAQILTGNVSGNGVSGATAQVIANNYPVNEYYLKPFSGFSQTGQQIIGDQPVYAGDPNPHTLLGFSTTVRYNKLSLVMNGSGAFGFLIYNNTFNTITNISQLQKGQNIALSNVGSQEAVSSGVAASTRYLEKGDYFKLRNASLNYAFGDVGKYFRNLTAFLSATNLFVITKFTGFDPEVNIDKNNNNYPSRSMEYLPYPTPRIITVGVSFGL